MMNFLRLKRFLYAGIILIATATCGLSSAVAQPSDAENPAVTFPVPPASEGAELLRYENIAFEADTTPMPDVAATVRSARKNEDASSMFITHMMYRDHIGDIDLYKDGKKQGNALSSEEQHREMIRWRDKAAEASYELAILATSPSVQYEISPMFANDDEFKKGLNWLKKAAAHGFGNAEYILGLVYFNGIGMKKDKKQGFELIVRAAAHGVVNAYYNVAMIYEMKLNGNEINTEKSMYWLEKAARYGSKDAIFILAMKYADGIDVPKDETKANELAKLDTKYHIWTKIYLTERDKFYHKYCVYKNDESAIGWSAKESSECGEEYVAHHTPDGFNEEEDEDDYNIVETAASSLDYKIDYRMAALWLKRIYKIENENSYILRSQAHHLIGCRGGLDGNKFKDIILYPDEDDDDAIDFDKSSRSFKIAMIALSDYKTKPDAVLEWLNKKAEAGDNDAIMTLGALYEHFDQTAKNKYEHKELYEVWSSNFKQYSPLYKKLK
ncbi:MAG: sel1 repeat family protein, partial [Proteobacteria bacterium]|nr:sel1 repeat family protein [Pseudomonadota bacterium]